MTANDLERWDAGITVFRRIFVIMLKRSELKWTNSTG